MAAATAMASAPEASAAPVAAPTEAPAPAAAAAASEAAAAALVLVPNKGDTTWMMLSTLLVILMTVPGLALFYGGLVRSKNMLSVLMQVMVAFSMIIVLWVIYGYSFAFTEGNAFIGGTDRLMMKGVWDNRGRHLCQRSHLQQGRGHSRDRVRGLPGHLRRHHRLPDHWRLCRTHQVQRRPGFPGPVVHLQLPAGGAHGLVLDGPGRLHRCRRGR